MEIIVPKIKPLIVRKKIPETTSKIDKTGLRLYLDFAELSGNLALDQSGYGNHGIIYGASRVKRLGYDALYFDGVDDYVDCGDDKSLRITDELTIEVWVKCYRVSGNNEDIIGKKSYSGYRIGATGDRIRLTIQTTGGYNDLDFWDVQLDAWYHIVGTFKKDNFVRLYVNNELKDKKEGASLNPGPIEDTTGASLILGKGVFTNTFFHGLIGKLRIYSCAKSERRVREDFENERILFGV